MALDALLLGRDPEVRAIALEVLHALRLGDPSAFAEALSDERSAVRVAAIHGLVSLNASDLIAQARTDSTREVRVAVAAGLGTVGERADALAELAEDLDALVRAAAFEAAANLGCVPPLDSLAVTAITDHAWQVRKGAAQALGAAAWTIAENRCDRP
jgi:HEAT repeat protein